MLTKSDTDQSNNGTGDGKPESKNGKGVTCLPPADKGGTEQTGQEKPTTDQKPQEHLPQVRDWIGFVPAGLSALAAIVSAVVAIFLYLIAIDANKVATAAANAAQRSAVSAETAVADAREHSHAELRAYLAVTDAKVVGLNTRQPKVVMTFKNVGNTPSKATYYIADVFCDTYPLSDVKLWGMAQTALQVGDGQWFSLASGQQVTTEGHKVDSYNREELRNKRAAIYAKVEIHYTDVFGYQCEERFGLIQGGPYEWDAESMGIYDPQP